MSKKRHASRDHDQRLQLDALEPRILMSATWVDPETGESIPGATSDGDRFEGSDQNDTADGLGGDDELIGGIGDDVLSGGAGDDILRGGAGDDTLDGGADIDSASYADASSSVTVDITDVGTPQDTGGAGTDTLYGVEGVIGSRFDDTFAFGNPIPGQTYTVDGRDGFNTLDLSGYERAALSFSADADSVVVDLGSGNSFTIAFENVSRVLTSDLGVDDAPEIVAPPTLQFEEGQTPQLGLLVIGGDPATMTWSWTQTAGTPIAIDDAAAARPVATIPEGLVDSSARFEVGLTIGSVTTTTTVDLEISADNDAAEITASDLTVPENSTVQLNANIDEPEGQPYLYTWTQVSGPAVTLNDAFSLTPSFAAPELASTTDIVFELSVTDGTTTATRQITVTVEADDDGPTANAGADATIAEDERSTDNAGADTYSANSYTLNGSGSDPEGQTLTYTWRQIGGPTVSLDDASLRNPTFLAPQGTERFELQFELRVSDGVNTTTDTVTITVDADQDRAVVDALSGGTNGVTDESATTTISISAYDPEGTPLTYTWRQVGGDPVTIADPSAATTTFTATNQMVDTYVSFEVDVEDADGTVSTKAMTILVRATNDLPTTDLGSDRIVAGNSQVQVATSASDPEGKPLVHRWVQTGGPDVTISGQGRDTLSFTAPEFAEDTDLTFEVQTTDGVSTVTDTITITVEATPANPGGGGAGGGGAGGGASGDPLTLDVGNFLATDEGDTTDLSVDVTAFNGPGPLTYSWTQVSGEPVTILDADTADASFVAPDLTGTRILQFEVEVSDGLTTRTELISVTVLADNDAPTVNAGPNQSVAEEGSVQLSASASDPEGKNLAGQWQQVSGPTVEIADIYDPNTTITTPNIVGTDDAVLRWVANDGENQASDTVTITIVANDDAPSVDAGPAANIPEASTYRLAPTVSDPEGQPLTYTWRQVGGPIVTLSDPNAARPTFATPNVASDTPIEFELEVSDGVHTVTDNVTLTIVADDDPPAVDAGPFQTVGEGDVVTLAGTASDPEGAPLGITWTQVGGPSVTLSDPNALNPTFTAPDELANTYITFRIEANDGTTAVTDTVTILVNADNDAPSNDAGADQTVAEESTVTLNGTASDPEGQQLTHRWTQVSGPPVALDDATALRPTFEAPNVLSNEAIVFQLETRDGTHIAIDTVTVTVTGVNDAPEASDVSASGHEDSTGISVRPTGSDPDFGDAIESIRIESLPPNGVLEFQGNPVQVGDVLAIADVDGGDLRFVPTADWAGSTSFEFRVSDGEAWSSNAGTSAIDVAARADEASIVAADVRGDEDTAISVPISVSTTDVDGSESIRWIKLRNAPSGSVFSDGVNTATYSGGQLTVTGWDLTNLTITPPLHRDLDFDFEIRAQTQDSNGNRRTTSETVDVAVNPINDAPFVSAISSTTTEDTDVAVTLTASEVDTGDTPEMYRIDSLPDVDKGVLLLDGDPVTIGDTVTQAMVDAGLLRFEPTDDLHGSATFEFRAWDGELWSPGSAEFTVEITADADAPTITVPTSIRGDEDTWIDLPIATAVTDTDGSESIASVTVHGLPVGASVTDGVNSFTATSGTTSVEVTSWNLANVQIRAPEHSDADFTVQVAATSREASNGDSATTTRSVAVQVDPVIDEVVLPTGSATTVEDTAVNLGLDAVFADTDGSESHVLILGGLPNGATITDGANTFTANGSGNSVDVGAWDLDNVTLTPPDDADADFQITVIATSTEADGGASDNDSGTIDVTVTADADAPAVTVASASGAEDGPIALSIHAGLTDSDGSESLTVAVSSIPVGATLSDGVHSFTASSGSTSTDVTDWNLGTLTVTPPADSGDDFTLVVAATSTEADGGDTASTIANLPVTVVASADAPTLSVGGSVSTLEDTPVAIRITSALTDTDGSEDLTIEIGSVPVGATLTDGVQTWTSSVGNTSVDVSDWDLDTLTVTPPEHSDTDFTLDVVATATEGENGATAATRDTIDVTVQAVVDAPTFSATSGSGGEDTAIGFTIDPQLVDADGSESIDVQLGDVPIGATISDGSNTFTATSGNTSVDVTNWNWNTLTVTPPDDDGREFSLEVTTTSIESSTGATSTRQDDVSITVIDRADAPTVHVSDAAGTEDTAIELEVSTSLTDTDGSESLTTVVSRLPVGATLSDGSNTFTATVGNTSIDVSSWSLIDLTVTPPADSDADFDLRVTTTATETANADSRTTVQDLTVTVAADTDAPTLATTAGRGTEDTAIPFEIRSSLSDTDGSETLSISITSIPVGATITDGASSFTATVGTTSLDVTTWDLANLSVTPPADSDTDFTLAVAATAVDRDGGPVTIHDTVAITVTADADAPVLSTPGAVTTGEDTAVTIPIVATVSDRDGSETITRVEVLDLPAGTIVSDGVHTFTASAASPAADITGWDGANLQLTPAADSDADFTIRVRATSTEGEGGDTATTINPITVAITAQADPATISTSAASGTEDTRIDLDLQVGLGDRDGSESLQVEVRDVPVGATLTDGVNTFTATVGTTTVDVSAWNRAAMGITPPADDAGDFTLTIAATTTEADGGDQQTTTAQLPVQVTADADAPNVSATNGSGSEDTAIPFSVSSQLSDTDGSEDLTVAIENIPVGATVSDGVHSFTATNGSTTADITHWNRNALTVTPPANSDADFSLTIAATATEAEGDTATNRTTASIQIHADADAPELATTASRGSEDTQIALDITVALRDTDGSEDLTLFVSGLPDGAILSDGMQTFVASPGLPGVDVTAWDLDALTVQPPADSDAEFDLTVTATSTERDGGATATTTNTIPVTVTSVADAPLLQTGDGSGDEDQPIPFDVRAELTDTDGSENLAITLSDVPPGARVTDGVRTFVATVSNTSTSLDGWNLGNLQVVPPTNDAADFRMIVTAVSTDADGGTATVTEDVRIGVAAVADAPTVATSSAHGAEDSPIALDIWVSLPDADGSESVQILLRGAPTGSVFADGERRTVVGPSGVVDVTGWDLGNLEVLPPAHLGDDFDLIIDATSTEAENGDRSTTTATIQVHVDPVADAPDGAAPDRLQVLPNQPQPFPIDLRTIDVDGSERLTVRVQGLWPGVGFSAGRDNGDGSWTFEYDDLADLTITAPPNGTTELTVEFRVDDGNSSEITTTRTTIQTLDLVPIQDAPEAGAWAPLPEANFDVGARFGQPVTPPATDVPVAAMPFTLPPVHFTVAEIYEEQAASYQDAPSRHVDEADEQHDEDVAPAKPVDATPQGAPSRETGPEPVDGQAAPDEATAPDEGVPPPERPWYVRLWSSLLGTKTPR